MTYAVLSEPRGTYARCDGKGCDTYPARFVTSGDFRTIEVPGRSMLARLDGRGSFVEVVTLGVSVMVSHGVCR